MKLHVFRLHRGDDLLESVRAYAARESLSAGAVISGVGCVTTAVLRDASGVTVHTLEGRREIVSLTGTVSSERTHLHISLADEEMNVLGGHLCPGTIINTTCEIVLLEEETLRFEKVFDPETGYNELVIRKDDTP